MDLTESITPRSDQQNFDDYLSGPRDVTISEVRGGSDEQPVEIHLVEFPGRPYKPSKSMRRVLVSAWGVDASTYTGRRLRLYGDPDVKFGGQTVGGIKIAAMSHIAKKLSLSLTSTRGKKTPHTVEPLPDAPPAPPTLPPVTPEEVAEFTRDIAAAESIQALDDVAADLKARDLGSQRAALLTAFSERKKVVEGEGK